MSHNDLEFLQDKGSIWLRHPEDDRAVFAEFRSLREGVSHFGGISDNALFVLGDRHPCPRWHVLEKFAEIRNWRRHDISLRFQLDAMVRTRNDKIRSVMTAAEFRTVRPLSWVFGFLIGGMWVGEVLLGNLGGTSVLGNLREVHPRIYAMAPWLALWAFGLTALGGLVAGYRTGSIGAALRVGIWSGVISGVITFATIMSITCLFHDAMMKDPSNIHEFARGAHRSPTKAELSSFLYSDAFAGGVNHIWIGPLLGLTIGGVGAIIGKLWHDDLLKMRR
jgi:hypothetical protein